MYNDQTIQTKIKYTVIWHKSDKSSLHRRLRRLHDWYTRAIHYSSIKTKPWMSFLQPTFTITSSPKRTHSRRNTRSETRTLIHIPLIITKRSDRELQFPWEKFFTLSTHHHGGGLQKETKCYQASILLLNVVLHGFGGKSLSSMAWTLLVKKFFSWGRNEDWRARRGLQGPRVWV